MDRNILGTNIVTQIGILVNDIETTSQAYADFFGVEKPQWIITDTVDKTNMELNGKPSAARAKLAFFKVGTTLELELIEPDHEPSTWRNHLDQHGEGVHHIAFEVEGMEEKVKLLEKNHMRLAQKGDYEGGRYAYIDSAPELKVMIELLENFKK